MTSTSDSTKEPKSSGWLPAAWVAWLLCCFGMAEYGIPDYCVNLLSGGGNVPGFFVISSLVFILIVMPVWWRVSDSRLESVKYFFSTFLLVAAPVAAGVIITSRIHSIAGMDLFNLAAVFAAVIAFAFFLYQCSPRFYYPIITAVGFALPLAIFLLGEMLLTRTGTGGGYKAANNLNLFGNICDAISGNGSGSESLTTSMIYLAGAAVCILIGPSRK